MTKSEYLEKLKTELKKLNIPDIEDIVGEYEQHFAFKLADGFTETEVAAKLGDPKAIAVQFECQKSGASSQTGGKVLLRITLVFAALFESITYLLFLAWTIALAAASLACAGIGVCLVGQLNIHGWIPYLPYLSALIFGIAFFALTVLLAGATCYCFAFTMQLIRASIRWHKNMLAGNTLPPLPWGPQFSGKARRRLRTVVNWSLILFGATSILAMAVSQIISGSLGFWHAWNWFVK